MYLVGIMNKMIKFIFLAIFLLLFSFTILGEDFRQNILGNESENIDDLDEKYDHLDGESAYISGSIKKKKIKPKDKKKNSYAIPGMTEDLLGKQTGEPKSDVGYVLPGKLGDKENLMTYEVGDLNEEIEKKGRKSFAINYILDTFDYNDNSGIFNKIFRDGKHSHNIGTLQVSYDLFYHRSEFIDYSLGGNFGYGYNEGQSRFVYSQDESGVEFKLVSIPLDLQFKVALKSTSWFKFELAGGPSVMGLYQTRNDRGSGEKGKRRRQVSWGYFGQGGAKLSMTNIFPKSYHQLYHGFEVTKVWFNVIARIQNYSNFQDEIKITGASLGIGFSFEYQ